MRRINCTVCGYSYNPEGQGTCQACPLYHGCNMICCPSCGYTTLDQEQSSLVRWASGLRRHRRRFRGAGRGTSTLRDMPPGTLARVFAFLELDKTQMEKLRAYGVSPGRWVRVLQQAPLTVIDLGNTELALETDLAGRILMDHSSTQSEVASS